MLAVLVIVGIAVAVVAVVVPAMSRQRRFNEVDRFHRARAMTTEWARSGITSPMVSPTPDSAEVDDKVS